MAITSTGLNAALNTDSTSQVSAVDKRELGKDDFMKLLLVELQYQDPTEPMDSEKILTQTSQLATLESAKNTTDSLEQLAASLKSSQQFATLSAIGKTADLGSDSISHDEGDRSTFEIYFPSDIKNGNVEVTDGEGNVISTIALEENPSGVYQFTWDGLSSNGDAAKSAIYHINAKYTNANGDNLTTKLGAYPIESMKFQDGDTLVKLGSNYIPLENISEIY